MKKTNMEKLSRMDMKEWRNFFDNIDEMAKRKTVTEKFETVKPALELCKEFTEDNKGTVNIEYGITGMSIIINCLSFAVNLYNMPKYRKLIEMVDCIHIIPKIDETIDINFDIKGIFKLPHSK